MSNHIEFRDPANLPTARYYDHPVDRMEPLGNEEDIYSYAAEEFRDCLLWLAENKGALVTIGFRALILVSTYAPERLEENLRMQWRDKGNDEARALVSEKFAQVWDWLADGGNDRVAFGLRAMVLLYIVRPDLLDGITLEEIGSMDNSSRQAVDKLVTEFRDMFAGFRNRAMKSENTRDKCQQAQNARN